MDNNRDTGETVDTGNNLKNARNTVLLRSQLNAKLFFRFQKLPHKATKISNLLE